MMKFSTIHIDHLWNEARHTAMNNGFAAAGIAWFDHPHEHCCTELLDGHRFGFFAAVASDGLKADLRSDDYNPLYPGLMISMMEPQLHFLVTQKAKAENGTSAAEGLLCNEMISVLRGGQMVIKEVPAAVERSVLSVRPTETLTIQLNPDTKRITQTDILCFDGAFYRIERISPEPSAGDDSGILKLKCRFLPVRR